MLDHAGKPIEVPKTFKGTYQEFAELVQSLQPHECSYPDGQRLHNGKPCKRDKSLYDCCDYHARQKQKKSVPFAKYLPKDVARRVLDAASNEHLLNVSHDVALVMARMQELMKRLDTGEYSDLWKALGELWHKLNEVGAAIAAEENPEAIADLKTEYQQTLKSIGAVIVRGGDREKAWAEIIRLDGMLSGLKRSETQRRREAGLTMDAEQAFALVGKLQDIITEEVVDSDTRTRIAVKLATLLGLQSVSRPSQAVVTLEQPIALVEQKDDVVPSVEDILSKFVTEDVEDEAS